MKVSFASIEVFIRVFPFLTIVEYLKDLLFINGYFSDDVLV